MQRVDILQMVKYSATVLRHQRQLWRLHVCLHRPTWRRCRCNAQRVDPAPRRRAIDQDTGEGQILRALRVMMASPRWEAALIGRQYLPCVRAGTGSKGVCLQLPSGQLMEDEPVINPVTAKPPSKGGKTTTVAPWLTEEVLSVIILCIMDGTDTLAGPQDSER